MLPSDVLAYGLIPPIAVGIHPQRVDSEPNLVSRTMVDAERFMRQARITVPPAPIDPESDFGSALAKVTLSLLLRHYAANKARFTGYQIGRGGRSETPLGSYDELMKAAHEYMRQAKAIFPCADWPPLGDSSAGVVPFRRVF